MVNLSESYVEVSRSGAMDGVSTTFSEFGQLYTNILVLVVANSEMLLVFEKKSYLFDCRLRKMHRIYILDTYIHMVAQTKKKIIK